MTSRTELFTLPGNTLLFPTQPLAQCRHTAAQKAAFQQTVCFDFIGWTRHYHQEHTVKITLSLRFNCVSFRKAKKRKLYLQSFEKLLGYSHSVFGAEEVTSSNPFTTVFNNC